MEGYLFDSKYIFNDYVDTLYKIKSELSKDNPLYTIAKLLLNSLYGRFGMKPEIEDHIIIDNKVFSLAPNLFWGNLYELIFLFFNLAIMPYYPLLPLDL